MISSSIISRFVFRVLVLLLAFSALHGASTFGQNQPERFWLAGRYDGNRVVIYFDAVKFQGTLAANSHKISMPVAEGFFEPVEISTSFMTRFRSAPNAEHFALGDFYDLMLGDGTIATVKLTTPIGCETDEAVGNDSYIGALGTVTNTSALLWTKGYYALRRHREPQSGNVKQKTRSPAGLAGLDDNPIRFDTQTEIGALLNQRMKLEATEAERSNAGNVQPAFSVQPFHVADGSMRYYVRAEWKSGDEPEGSPIYVMAAWMTPIPTLHILAVETQTSPYDGLDNELPSLLNVVDLDNGKTGVVIHIKGEDSMELDLAEYRDGFSTKIMQPLQSIATGE